VNRWRSLDSTFCKLKAKLTDSLSKSPLLEAEDGTFKAPNVLMYIPSKFRDDDGIPLTLSPTTSRRYLSSKYFESDQKDLLDLGVQEMNDMQFLVDLAALISQHGPEFRQKRKRYHSMLAAAITPFLGSRDGKAVQLVKTLPLLRLRGGTWATASELPIYFPGETEGHEIPEGVDARVTISKWSRDRQIQCLYLMLGVRHLSATEICSLIIKSHQSPNFKSEDLSPDVLISHVVFLFRSDWRTSVSPELWFAAENGGRFRGSQLYKDSPADTHSVKKYLRNRRVADCTFLHSDYIFFAVSAEEEEKWTEWLRDVMNIWTIPRLVKPEPVDGQLVMTEQFRHIIRHFPFRTVLLLLRDNWKVYSEAIVVPMVDKDGAVAPHKRKIKPAASSLVEGLSRTTVQCSGNRHFLLCQTFLPLGPWISAAADIVPFLEITEPEDSRWSYLEYFGVGVREDVRFHLKCLSELACAGEGSDSTWKRVSGLYESIQRLLDIKGDVELVR